MSRPKSMDLVLIEGLEVRTVIGIYDWEREIRQTVRLDIEMAWDVSQAGASDEIADTLDYKMVSKRLISFVEGSKFGLIEALAERCAAIVIDEFSVPWLRLKLSKPGAVRGSENVAVVIERSA
ncbi:MAG: dihydroneopterin aldolase [Mariprofundales bacterium]|nr:dihydroneopterin aldolase [Mariprofundales bacterium]